MGRRVRQCLLLVGAMIVGAACASTQAAVSTANPPSPPTTYSPYSPLATPPSTPPSPTQTPTQVLIKVPHLGGMTLSAAKATLQDRGLGIVIQYTQTAAVTAGRVIRTDPKQYALVTPGRRVTVWVAKAPPKPTQSPSPNCDPNYTGACLKPNVSDYDCAGGSGDGPYYTGTVYVVGVDHYGLDADGDGVGCE